MLILLILRIRMQTFSNYIDKNDSQKGFNFCHEHIFANEEDNQVSCFLLDHDAL